MLHGFFARSIVYISTSKHPICFLWYGSTKLNGGMSINPSYATKKMWSSFTETIQKIHSPQFTAFQKTIQDSSCYTNKERKLLVIHQIQDKRIIKKGTRPP